MKRILVNLVTAVLATTSVVVGGLGAAPPAGAQTPPVVPEPYVGVTPVRVLEPLVGGVGGGPMATGDVRTLTVTGVGAVPAAVEAVDLTVTATRLAGNPMAKVFVSTGGTTTTVPALTVKSIGSRQVATVTVAPSSTGEIRVHADAAVDVQIDVRGYFAVDSGFTAAEAPAPVLSTTTGLGGGPLVGGQAREVGVVGIGGVPATGVAAVVARVVVTSTTAAGVVRVAPAGAPSTVGEATRFNSASERVSSVVMALGHEGRIRITSTVDVDAVVVVDGWFDDSRGFTPVVPTTVVDNVLVQPGASVTAASAALLPDTGVGAVAVQVVATGSTSTVGSFSLQAATGQETTALSIGGPTANQRGGSVVWTPVRSDGTFDVALSSGMPATRATVSVVGWTAAPVGTDTTQPTATVESPTPGTTIDATDSGSLTMVVAASDPGSGVAAVEVTVAGTTTPARVELVGTDLRWVVEVAAIASGSQDYVVDVADRAGNVRTVTATYTLSAPGEEDTVLDPDTTVVDGTVGELTAYDAGTGVMVFTGDVTATVRPGQILASDPTTLAPRGYLRVVTGLSRTGATTTVRTRQAAVTEAVRQADIDVTLPPEEVARRAAVELELAQTHTAQLTLDATYVSGAFTSTFSLAGGVTASVGLRIRLEIDLGWGVWPEVTRFEAVAEAALTVSASETISAEFHKAWTRPTPFLSISLGAIPTPIPGVVITPELNLDADADVTISGSLTAEFTTGKRFQVGVIYDGETWDEIAEEGTIGGGFTVEQTGSIEFSAQAGVSARLNISINDTVGLYVEARAAIELTGAATTGGGFECGASLGITVSAGTDVQIPLIDLSLMDIPFGEIPLADWDLFNVSCPSGTPVETVVEGTGGPFPGEEELISVTPAGLPANHGASGPSASEGAGVVAFTSSSTDLVGGTTISRGRVYARDVVAGTTELVSIGIGSTDPNGSSSLRDITPSGRFVLFNSTATNLVPGLTTSGTRLYVYDRQTDTTHFVIGGPSTDPCRQANVNSEWGSSLSDDGRFVLFSTDDPCVAGDTNGDTDSFVIDRSTGVIERVSLDDAGGELSGQHSAVALSADGRYAAFATNDDMGLGIPSPSGWYLVRRDRLTGRSQVVRRHGGPAFSWARMDGSGQRFFDRQGSNGVTCPRGYLIDLAADTTLVVDSPCFGQPNSASPGISRDGRYVSFAEDGAAVVIDTATGAYELCGPTVTSLSDDARWFYGQTETPGSAPEQVKRARCR
jgi:hypothetical protein